MQLIAALRIIEFKYKLMTVPLLMLRWRYELRYTLGGNGKINEVLERGLYHTSKHSSPKLNFNENKNKRNLNTRRGN